MTDNCPPSRPQSVKSRHDLVVNLSLTCFKCFGLETDLPRLSTNIALKDTVKIATYRTRNGPMALLLGLICKLLFGAISLCFLY